MALWPAGLAAHVVQLSLAGRHRRAEYRFAESLAVGLRVLRDDGKLASTDIAITEDLTATGLALRCMYPIPVGSRIVGLAYAGSAVASDARFVAPLGNVAVLAALVQRIDDAAKPAAGRLHAVDLKSDAHDLAGPE